MMIFIIINFVVDDRPDITVMVDWAYNTKLLTYSSLTSPDHYIQQQQ